MGTLNIRHINRGPDGRVIIGEGDSHEQEHTHRGNVPLMEIPSFNRDIRREILTMVQASGRAVTRKEIADALGVRKTTWLNDAIEDLRCRGYLIRHETCWKNGVTMYFYTLA